eukprot:121608_1
MSRENSIQYETKYNSEHKDRDDVIVIQEEQQEQQEMSVYNGYIDKFDEPPQNATQLMKFSKLNNEFKTLTFREAKNIFDGRQNNKSEKQKKVSQRIRRITRFKGKILKIDTDRKSAQVRINYSKEYGKQIGVWFNFRDCNFNPHYLKINDDVEYNLRGNVAVNIKLWLIPFKYIYVKDYAKLRFNNNDNNIDYDKWNEFTYHKCRELEEKFNPTGNDDCKDFDCSFNNELVRVKRIKTFKSNAIIDRNQC